MSAIAELPMPNTYVKLMLQVSPAPAQVLAGTTLTLADIVDGNAPVRVWQQIVCAENFAASQQSPDWHLAWVLKVAERFHGPITAAALSAPTLRDGVEVFVRYMPTRVPYLDLEAETRGANRRIAARPLMPLGDLASLLVEIPLLMFGSYIHTVNGRPLPGLHYEFAHAPLANLAQYEQHFSGRFTFNALQSAITMPAADLDQQNPGHDEILWQAALRRCEAAAEEYADASLVRLVVNGLHESLDRPWGSRTPPTLADMADRLHVSVSTLNRRLREAGTSYQVAVDDVRSARAREMLANRRIPIGNIATALGYTDAAGFVRAFKRWYGTTPRQFRRSLLTHAGNPADSVRD